MESKRGGSRAPRGVFYRSCLKKRRYESESEASINGRYRSACGAPALRPYECGLCKGWHLTRAPRENTPT